MKKFLLLFILLWGFIALFAQVPQTISYQGILVKTSGPDAGKPVDDGNHYARFRFYTTETGGTPVYSSDGTGSGNLVTTFKGMFSFIIGSGSPGNDPIPSSIFNQQLWVEIIADGVTLTPRVRLTTTPYAFTAQTANTMDAANLTGTLNPARIAAGAIDNSKLATGIDASKLTTGTLPAARIGNDAIDNAKMADNAVNTAEIVNLAVTTAKLADNAVTSAKITDGTIVTADLADGSVSTVKLADNSVTSAKIIDGSISNADIDAAAAIAVSKLAAGSAGQILTTSGGVPTWTTPVAGGTVTNVATGTGLTGGPITTTGTVSIATGGVTTTLLADNSVTSAKIVDATIATADLADNSVTSAKIVDGSVTTTDLADNSVTSAKIVDGTIAAGDLNSMSATAGQVLKFNGTNWAPAADNAGTGTVTSVATGTGLTGGPITTTGTVSIATGGVTTTLLADNSVTSAKIVDATIVTADIADGAITAAKLAAGSTLSGSGTNGHVTFWTGSGTMAGSANLFWNNSNNRLGIGNSAPASFLDVTSNGGQWDLSNTEGDVRIGTNTHRIKMGIATTGGGAGDAYIGSQGGTNRLFLGAGTTTAQFQTITITGGRVGIGTTAPGSKLHVAGADYNLNPLLLSANAGTAGATIRFTSPDAGNHTYDIIGSTGTGALTGAGSFGIWDQTVSEYRFVISPTGTVGIGLTAPNFRLDLPNTTTDAGGRGRANSWVTYSDTRVKTGQKPINYGLKEVLAMNPKRYVHHSSDFESGKLSLKEGYETIGLIAQEVYQVIPEIVSKPQDESKELWSLDYHKLVPVLIKAIQEQQILIENQNASIGELKAELAELKRLLTSVQAAPSGSLPSSGRSDKATEKK